MLKNKNLRYGLFVFLITLIGLLIFANSSSKVSTTELTNKVEVEDKKDFAIKP